MKKIELTKKGKIILMVACAILVLSILLFVIFKFVKPPKAEYLSLNVTPISEDSKWDNDKLSLILHVNSQAQLTYNLYPENAKINEISFNNYNEDIINIDSLGVITGLKTGTTDIQVYGDDLSSYRIKVYVY